MFCPNCGTQINNDATFCGNCGAPVNAQAPQQPQQPPQGAPYGSAPQAPALGMKWFKFLIYFLLFAGGILNIAGGISALTGAQYGSAIEAKLVYAFFPDLKTIDIIYGVACIALGIFQIYVRFQLAGYKAKAPKLIMSMYIATAIIVAVYSFAAAGIVPAEIVDHGKLIGQGVGSVVGSIVMMVLNKVYFDKRKDLFVK